MWHSVKDKSIVFPSNGKEILVTDGKNYSIVSVESLLKTIDKPFNNWTHWMEIPRL